MPIPQMDELKSRLVAYGQFVQEMIEKSRRALVTRQPELPREIIDTDGPGRTGPRSISKRSARLSSRGTRPMAKELRTILMVMGITNDLERIADHSVNIAEAVVEHINGTTLRPEDDVLTMFEAKRSRWWTGPSAHSSTKTLPLARRSASPTIPSTTSPAHSRGLERLHDEHAQKVPETRAAENRGNLERIADLSTNIGEDVIYMTEGRVIKHHQEEDAKER